MSNRPVHDYLIEPEWFEEQGAFLNSMEHNLCQWLIGLGVLIVVSLWVTS